MTNIEIIPAVVPATLTDAEDARLRYAAVAATVHVDAADGIFAPNLTWMPAEGERLSEFKVSCEAHLMAHDPHPAGVAFARAGAFRIIAHVEAFPDLSAIERAVAAWKAAGAKEVGLAALIETPLEVLERGLSLCDFALLMTIDSIGTEGIPFDRRGIVRVAELHARRPDLLIAVDGGVSGGDIAELARAGARRFVVGSALSQSADPAGTFASLKSLAENAVQ